MSPSYHRMTAGDVRDLAASYARDWADMRDGDGDPEGAECFRMLAREIAGIRILDATAPENRRRGRP